MSFVRDPNCLTPIMTSNTSDKGNITCSTSGTAIQELPFNAFNGAVAGGAGWWADGNVNEWVQFSFTTLPIDVPTYYNIYPCCNVNSVYIPANPKDWEVRGSNDDGKTWTVVDSQSNQTSWIFNTANTYKINGNSIKYKNYRLFVLKNNGYAHTVVSEFELCSGTSPLLNSQRPQAIGGF